MDQLLPQLTIVLNMVSTLLVAIPNVSIANPEASPNCRDYLNEWQLKPAHLKLSHCEPSRYEHEGPKAIYKVSGSHAAGVEDLLHHEFQMARLRFICCGWEAHPFGGHVDETGQYYVVRMYSEETLLQQRSDWPQISTFWVTVRP